ncbi:chitobiase/beta-hexosaminidase C-terminal domain-containing protein [Maribacter sp. BPC-D8]|uniref:FN3 associated domain-containing protein n=1 Tax=Maribacter sp. BPC-D8 TaxID=3053613 RepID=UPI002B4751C7|nr:FN3 associated domain-containing protein [Maribacter sp. BPC-D8]WRI28295.1 chitobiase/beta-hexosaminidase C-terminal domain-containing protein [Maribacter sp. BPC-D8]
MMKRTIFSLFTMLLSQIVISQNAATEMFQLASPKMIVSAVFFDSFTTLEITKDLPNSVIKYSLDGSGVNQDSKVYNEPLRIDKSVVIKAVMYHPDYLESDEVQLEVVKIAKKSAIKSLVLNQQPSEKYSGLGAAGLMDLKKGSAQFGGDKQWLGYQTDSVSAMLQLERNSEVSQVVLSALTNQSNWIFAPGRIEVFYDGKLIGTETYSKSEIEASNGATFLTVPVMKGTYNTLNVVIYPLSGIPEWHQGKGTTPWLFIDEIIIQ